MEQKKKITGCLIAVLCLMALSSYAFAGRDTATAIQEMALGKNQDLLLLVNRFVRSRLSEKKTGEALLKINITGKIEETLYDKEFTYPKRARRYWTSYSGDLDVLTAGTPLFSLSLDFLNQIKYTDQDQALRKGRSSLKKRIWADIESNLGSRLKQNQGPMVQKNSNDYLKETEEVMKTFDLLLNKIGEDKK